MYSHFQSLREIYMSEVVEVLLYQKKWLIYHIESMPFVFINLCYKESMQQAAMAVI